MASSQSAAVALTMGDPRGIGIEITLKAWLARSTRNVPPFVYVGTPEALSEGRRQLGFNIPLQTIERAADAAAVFPAALPVLPSAGAPDATSQAAAIHAIETAVHLCRSGECAAMVTNPVHKKSLWDAGFAFPGHTDFIAELCRTGPSRPVPIMMLMNTRLKVVPVTVHIPLAEVPAAMSAQRICETAMALVPSVSRDFGIADPRLAVAALNPHAGEEGGLGREEIESIAPAVARLRAAGLNVSGPHPADTLFHETARARYDVCLCMYHDQALIPLKTIDFHNGVNVTLGLPVVRTSPDHGTAFDIAGRNMADPSSLIAALGVAADIAERRRRGGA